MDETRLRLGWSRYYSKWGDVDRFGTNTVDGPRAVVTSSVGRYNVKVEFDTGMSELNP